MTFSESATRVMRELLMHFGSELAESAEPGAVLTRLADALDDGRPYDKLWLTWAALRGELPTEYDIIMFRRDAVLNGTEAALANISSRSATSIFGFTTDVEIIADAVLVDVHNTASAEFMSGIQRVVHETTVRWAKNNDLEFVAWTENHLALRRLTPRELHAMTGDPAAVRPPKSNADDRIVVPLRGVLVVPELAADSGRAERLLALARFSSTRVSYIGYDCVPLTSGETAATGMAGHFPLYLDAVAHGAKVAAISQSTADEFVAWKKMLPSSGRIGPDVRTVFLGGDSASATEADLQDALRRFEISADEPVVLVVGSHEPRKNHLSVLNAARALWKSGLTFRLVLIGSGSWNSSAFDQLAQSIEDEGRHINVVSNATDSLLSASYRLAAVSIFTSFHEGFGLPIVESLRAGTPVIASNVGSMAEIAATYGGVISVDPHSDAQLETALRAALTDPSVLEGKRRELAENEYRSWDSYAAETWSYLVSE